MILAIDPSINNVGLALIDGRGELIEAACLKSKGDNSPEKTRSLCEQLRGFLEKIEELELILIEHTRYFARSKNQSHASAQKLNLAKGAIYATCLILEGVEVKMIWIPGFDKTQASLLARSLGISKKLNQHELDAFWLAHTWSKSPEALRAHWLESSQF